MIFKNLITYRLASEWTLSPGQLEERLAQRPLTPCTGLNTITRGWVPPIDKSLVYSQGRAMLIAMGVEQKSIPGPVLRKAINERADDLERMQGFKPGRKQLRDIKEAVVAELLPRAFAKPSSVRAWIDPESASISIDATSVARAEEVLSLLRDAVDVSIELPEFITAPETAMTQWLAAGVAPGNFEFGDGCQLMAKDANKATIQYSHHSIGCEDVRRHIGDGKRVARATFSWKGRLSFVLNNKYEIRRVRFIDEVAAEEPPGDITPEQIFDADFALATGDLRNMLGELNQALSTVP